MVAYVEVCCIELACIENYQDRVVALELSQIFTSSVIVEA